MARTIRGFVMKGLFEGELRYFFYPDRATRGELIFAPFSTTHFKDFLFEVTIRFMYFGYKMNFRRVVLGALDYEEIPYPVFVEGVEVRAVHPLIALEQCDLQTHVAFYNEMVSSSEKEKAWITQLSISLDLMRTYREGI